MQGVPGFSVLVLTVLCLFVACVGCLCCAVVNGAHYATILLMIVNALAMIFYPLGLSYYMQYKSNKHANRFEGSMTATGKESKYSVRSTQERTDGDLNGDVMVFIMEHIRVCIPLYEAFRQFCIGQFCVENILFFVEAYQFPDKIDKPQEGRRLYTTVKICAASAECRVPSDDGRSVE
jgi:hypothetical protein